MEVKSMMHRNTGILIQNKFTLLRSDISTLDCLEDEHPWKPYKWYNQIALYEYIKNEKPLHEFS